jgi:hypothetical protein
MKIAALKKHRSNRWSAQTMITEWGQVTYLPEIDAENKLLIASTDSNQYHG